MIPVMAIKTTSSKKTVGPTTRKRAASKPATPEALYQICVILTDIEPDIWRQIQVPSNATLDWLRAVLQVAMGWTNSHLHHFCADRTYYGPTGPDADPFGFGDTSNQLDERKFTLRQLAPAEGASFFYEYDFGDSWLHEVRVEKILPPDPKQKAYAVCLDGANKCPPEDCGGAPGYLDILEVLGDPTHPDHRDTMEWLGDTFDPQEFNAKTLNTSLKKLKWPHVTAEQLAVVLMARDGY